MTHFVLVHGASHGAWCWEPIIPLLAADPRVGDVIAVDLPGHGAMRDVKPAGEITLDDYVDHVATVIEAGMLEEVVLVGHSLAGLTLPPVARRLASRLRRVVYIASTNPAQSRTVLDMMASPLSPVARGLSMEEMFCNDLEPEATAWLMSRLIDEPPQPMETAVEVVLLPEGVSSTYILLEKDETLPPAYQREQAKTAGVDEVISLDTGHSAFVANPGALADLLLRCA